MDLLQGYTSESDTEESEIETVDELPPVPDIVSDKYSIPPNTFNFTEDIESMRFTSPFKIKDFKANKGKWSSFLFIEYKPSLTERKILTQAITDFNSVNLSRNPNLQGFQPLHVSTMGIATPLHISLSRNILFDDASERDQFYHSLRQKLAQMPQFLVQFEQNLKVLTAREKSTLYLTLDLKDSVKKQYIVPIMDAIEQSLRETRISDPKSYIFDPEFAHMSIADIKSAQEPAIEEYQPKHSRTSRVTSYIFDNTPIFYALAIKYNRNRQILTIPLKKTP
ncbi:phosphoric diester hydrolase RNJ42_00697 [Nakaseomyces bracarensis]|uniref:phosphoric diester hydrolase n=1 Tax=Nakaseomyces bracarensis TaxID=273131 RepID=UPI0038723964